MQCADDPTQSIRRSTMMRIIKKEVADFMTIEENSRVTGHSFRGGRANDCFADKMDEEMIKRIGRWAHFSSVTE